MKNIYVVGNGKSLESFDFNFLKDKEWIGLCVAFRHWEELGFYPTHYVCVDNVVCNFHAKSIKEMIDNKKCQTFLLTMRILKIYPELKECGNVFFMEQLKYVPYSPMRALIDYCSGSSAVCYGYLMNPDNLYLLGMDCDYVEFLPECVKQRDGSLKIIKTPKENPNYYFNSYQRKGDLYNPPNTERVHKQSWFDLRNLIFMYNNIMQKNVNVWNINYKTTLDDYFERKSFHSINGQSSNTDNKSSGEN